MQRRHQLPLVALAGLALPPGLVGPRKQPEPLLDVEIAPLPPAAQGRQIVAADHGQSQGRVGFRRHELAGLDVLLEEQHAVGEDIRRRHALAEALRHRAEVLADDEAAVPLAFEGENSDQIVERILDIGAFRRVSVPAAPSRGAASP